MKRSDHAAFAAALSATFSVYSIECTPLLLDAWWTALEPYTLAGVEAALAYHVGDYVGFGWRAPTPADVRKILEETLPALKRHRCSAILADAMTRIAPHREAINHAWTMFDDLHIIGTDEYTRTRTKEQEAIDAINAEPQVVEARAPITFRDATLPAGRMPLPVEKAIAVIGRVKK